MTTIAQNMALCFADIPMESDNGSKWDYFKEFTELYGFVRQCQRACEYIDYPLGEDSCDPTTRFKFEDGSVLEIANPWQDSYPASATVIHE